MKIQDKIKYLQDNYFSEWIKKRKEIEDKLSEENAIFCVCGRLATGLHEKFCRKFQNKVTSETVKELKHLLTQPKG